MTKSARLSMWKFWVSVGVTFGGLTGFIVGVGIDSVALMVAGFLVGMVGLYAMSVATNENLKKG